LYLDVCAGCADAWGTVQYFNVSRTRVREGEDILFKCGTTLEETDEHSLISHIKKWFPGSTGQTLTTNEEISISDYRMTANLKIIIKNDTQEIQEITEIDFRITSTILQLISSLNVTQRQR